MSKLQTKIAGILLILSSYKSGHAQLTLENIFLTDKYVAVQADDYKFLHTQPAFAKLIDVPKGKNIALFNSRNQKINEWKVSEYSMGGISGNWSNLVFSNTDHYFLVSAGCQQLYRRSFACTYYVGDNKGMLKPVSTGIQFFPSFSPDDKKIAFVKDNNLFYTDISSGSEVQVTGDGEWNSVINGKSDWVYEEELELTRAYEWNAQSDKIAYLRFDESRVKEYSIPMYYDMPYPNFFTYKYPKAGEENSKVSVWLYDMRSKKNKQVSLPFSYEYIPRIYWNATGDELIIMLLNRHQDSLQLVGYNTKTKMVRKLYLDESITYLSVPKTVTFLSDNSFILNSERDGFDHFYHYDKDGKLLQQLTKGNYEVSAIYGVDEKHQQLYYQSNEGNETETSIFSLNYQTLEKKKLSTLNGSNKAAFSNDYSFFVHTYSSAVIPPKISVEQTDLSSSYVQEENKALQDSLQNIPKKEFIKIPANGVLLNAWMIRPANTDSTAKHPLLMFTYGGPGHQEVLNEWTKTRDLFFNYLAQQGYAVACVDNRGSDGRGVAFKKITFLNLGKIETADQVAAGRYFATLPYIDKTRLGIYGWSYGGSVAAMSLFEGNDVFKSAIAVAPVTQWKLYDNIYTERSMHTPDENPAGYNNFNPLSLAKKLSGNFLLIHGMADDNVHFQHSVFLINALNDAHKKYELYIYPDRDHGIGGKKMRYDVHLKMMQFIQEKL